METPAAPYLPTLSSPSPFGVLIPGQPVLTDAITPIDGERWTLCLPCMPTTLCVFLTNAMGPLNPLTAVTLYTGMESDGRFEYVGSLTVDRPSVLVHPPVGQQQQQGRALLGFALLPRREAENMEPTKEEQLLGVGGTSTRTTQPPNTPFTAAPPSFAPPSPQQRVAERLLGEMYQFIVSYGRTVRPQEPLYLDVTSPEEYILLPGSFVEKWRTRLQKRIEKDPLFLQQ